MVNRTSRFPGNYSNCVTKKGFQGWRKIIGFVILILIIFIGNAPEVEAQQVGQWKHDERVPGYFDDTFTPVLIADQNRTVHAFASQWVEHDSRQLAVVYRTWSLGGGWTAPVDILLLPDGDAQVQGAFLDSKGIMHVIFWGGPAKSAAIYYSSSPVESADRSSSWSAPLYIGEGAVEPISAALAGDDQGNLFVIYTGNTDGSGVYAVHSADSGRNWSKSDPIFLTNDPTIVPYSLRLFMGQAGQLHATWNVVTSLGVDISIYYTRYDVANAQWADPVMLNKRIDIKDYFGPSFPSIVDNGEDIVIMYNSGNPFRGRPVDPGRPVQVVSTSNDGGKTWKDPIVPFYRLLGRSGEHSLVVDRNHNVHALFTQRIEYSIEGVNHEIGGIWHSSFQDGIWSDPDRFTTTYAPHDVRAVVSQGNILLVVWREDPGAKKQHGIWYSYTILNSPELPVAQSPTHPVSEIATQALITTVNPALLATPTAPISFVGQENAPTGIEANPAGSLIIAIIPVILVLAVVIVVYQFYRNRR